MFAAKNELFTRPSGYTISRSVRLRSSASAYFNRTFGTPTSTTTWSLSWWVKRGNLTANAQIFSAGGDFIYFGGATLVIKAVSGAVLETSQVFRDPSAWYHFLVVADTTNATADNRVKFYVNGSQVTAFSSRTNPSQNAATIFNAASSSNRIGGTGSAEFVDGYLTEINFIDGQALTPASFGETDAVTGVWKPKKYAGTYGTNGFYLNFSDNSSNTATTIGKDYSGNGNNWTPNNISVTSGVTYDSMIDVPTMWADGGNGRGNYAVLNPLKTSVIVDNGNLRAYSTAGVAKTVLATQSATGIKIYYEVVCQATDAVGAPVIGLWTDAGSISGVGIAGYGSDGYFYFANGTNSSGHGTYTTNDVIMVAYDSSNGKVWYGKNGTWTGSGDPATGTNPSDTLSSTQYQANVYPSIYNYGSSQIAANFGQQPFSYTPPSGFVALNTQNLPAPTISNGALYMAATLYTGNGTTTNLVNSVNGVSFKPDLVWQKNRSSAANHILVDSVRGGSLYLIPNSTSADASAPGYMTFNSNGESFTSSDIATNQNGQSYVSWQWQAGAGTTSSNTSGSITSTVSVNATAGFSVVSFNSGTAGNKTVGHGLGVAPSLIITKNRDGVASWAVWSSSFSNTAQGYLLLNGTGAVTNDSRQWANTAPTSTVFSFESGYTFTASNNIIAYCFSAVRGYSAFGSYTGNGSSDGPFVYLGFRPRWLLLKVSSAAGFDWLLYDSSRNTYNVTNLNLRPDLSDAEGSQTANNLDFLSNGFKIRGDSSGSINPAQTIIYAAFAENPFKLSLAR